MEDNWVAYNGMKMPEELKGKKVKIQIRGVSRAFAEQNGKFWAAETYAWNVERDRDSAIVCYLVEEEPMYLWVNEYNSDRGYDNYFGVAYPNKKAAELNANKMAGHRRILKLSVVEEEE